MHAFRLLIIVLAWPIIALLPGYAQVEVTALKTEYIQTPLGIDVEQPRFSWQRKKEEAMHKLPIKLLYTRIRQYNLGFRPDGKRHFSRDRL